MTKQAQFLLLVQTTLLAERIDLARQPDSEDIFRGPLAVVDALNEMNDALEASERIPKGLPAFEAAVEYCGFKIPSLRKRHEAATRKPMPIPYWFAGR